jgi:stage II sporulation protein D
MVMAAIMLLLATVAPERVRVDVLSLLVPQRVEIVCVDRTLDLPGGGRLAPGAILVVERSGGDVIASAKGWRWRGPRLVVGAPGARLDADVRGRDRRRRPLPGPLEIASDGGRLHIVASYTLEELVAAAVAAEFDQVREPAALEAGAVAIRSYVLASGARHASEGFDLCDTTHCVHSRGLADDSTPAGAAARATDGLVLARAGRVVAGYCTACCGGRTATPSLLWGGEDGGEFESVACAWCSASPYFRWRRVVGTDSVARAVEGLVGRRVGPDLDLHAETGEGAWVRSVVVRSSGRETRVGGDAFRMAVERRLGWDSIPSPRFTLERHGGAIVVRGGGYGHGIGLCVAGAVARARAGASREAILSAYFPRARVELLGSVRSVYSSLF